MKVLCIVLIVLLLLICAGIFCGLTTVRFPGRKRAGLRVACVGDSLTYGCMIPGCFFRSYPRVLGRLLGKGYCVCNFGVSDRTAQRTGNKPYCREKAYRESLAFQPDIVVLLIGSNDIKDVNRISEEHFLQEYDHLVGTYAALPSHPRIILCTPTTEYLPIAKLFYLTNDVPADRIGRLSEVIRGYAVEKGLELAELFLPTQGRRDLLGPDGVHPNARGAAFMAGEIYRVMQNVPAGSLR